jgi:hypothetical protein
VDSVKASVIYERGIPGWRPSLLESAIQRGTKLGLTAEALEVTRGKQSLSIPFVSIEAVSLERGFMDNRFAVIYVDPSGGQPITAVFRFPGLKGGSVTGERIVEQLRAAGVSETEFHHEREDAGAEGDRPQPGLFAPWYVREAGPLVVKKYDDNWVGRNDMNREIQEAAKGGWTVTQTQTVAGHVNVGWVIMMLVFFWTIIVPLLAVFNLRTAGHFVVTFEKQVSLSRNPSHERPREEGSTATRDLSGALRQLRELREQDLITEEEFEAKRKQLIDGAWQQRNVAS